jgi:hypothetical protein
MLVAYFTTFQRPKFIVTADGTKGVLTGASHPCSMAGCTGMRITVRWPDGHWTFPCTKGMTPVTEDTWRIG